MALTGTSDLYIFELLCYLLLLPVIIYLGYRHGSAGVLGYFYLHATCAVRIAADIVSLLPANRDAAHPTIATAVLSSVGLSPLMLALSGFLHEAHVRTVDATPRTTGQAKKLKRWLWFTQIQIHGVAIIGMVLAIVGSVKLVASPQMPLTNAQVTSNEHLRSAGALLLLLLWVGLTQYSIFIARGVRHIRTRQLATESIIGLGQMTKWIILTTMFIGVRCVYSVLYTFDHHDSKLNPISGSLWVKVVFVVLPSLGAVMGMCLSGWVSQNLANASLGLAWSGPSNEDVQQVAMEAGRKD